jgi:thioredoxin-related protein
MIKITKWVVLMAFAFGVLSPLQAADNWVTDLPKAQAQAKKEKKLVLIDFTGSDWCPPCKALKKDVFSSKEFLDYAKDKFVLVEIDFPNSKPQSAELKKANKALSEKYKIEGFPTVVVLDADGKELKKEVGYSGEKPKEYIAMLDKLVKK